MRVKGMVQVKGATYRVVRERVGFYEVVRLLDDVTVGRFNSEAIGIDPLLMAEIARVAIQGAKLSWLGKIKLDE